MLPEKEDHVEIGLSRLKSQWEDKPVIQGLMKSYLEKIQDVEDTAEYYKTRSIFNSTGEDLDRIGRLYGVLRNAREDASYRTAILGYIASTEPNASPEGVVEACKSYGQTNMVRLHEHFPCHTAVYMGEGVDPDMHSVLETLVPAGTSVVLYFDEQGDGIVFAEELQSDEVLLNDQDEGFELEYEEDGFKVLAVSSSGVVEDEVGIFSEFAEDADIEFHPFAEQHDRGVEFQSGDVIDEEDDNISDEDDNDIIYVDFRFKN